MKESEMVERKKQALRQKLEKRYGRDLRRWCRTLNDVLTFEPDKLSLHEWMAAIELLHEIRNLGEVIS